jgi:ribosome biogenesis protein Tsr3
MALHKRQKALILKAFFESCISRDEMETLLNEGIAIHPTEWVYSNEVERRSQARKRALIQKVFGSGLIPEIEWVRTP